MSEKLQPLRLEEQYKDRTFTEYVVEGLSVDEMNEILRYGDDAVQRIFDAHGNEGTALRWGYGIYGIRHFGGNLLLKVGNSCD